ncbi:MAG: sialidase family protein, partial [Flavobacteriales bacterium]
MKQSIQFASAMLFIAAGLQAPLFAQQQVETPSFSLSDVPQIPVEARIAKPMPTVAVDGFSEMPLMPFSEEGQIGQIENIQTRSLVVQRQVIGLTQYDLQSNAAIDDRLVGSGDAISAGWIMSLETGSFPDRGTGYNFFDGDWDEQPYERIESVRCGWASIGQTASGTEYSVTHPGIDTPFLITSRQMGSGDSWSEMSIPMDGPSGVLWPRTATSGVDGNTIHVLGISTPVGNGGVEFQGQDGALLYYRSLDNGVTWEQQTFEALDTTNFVGFSGDTYAMHARDGMVAFAVFNDFRDTFVMISEDNGDNWEYTAMID